MTKDKELYLSGFQNIIELICLANHELTNKRKRLREEIPDNNTSELVDFLNDSDKCQILDTYLGLPDYTVVIQRLYWRCKNIMTKLRYEELTVEGFMDDLMWQDLGKIDALVEISEYIEVTKKQATAKEQHIIIYLETMFQKLLEQAELSTLIHDDQDKFICLYTKLAMVCSKDYSENCLDLKRLGILDYLKKLYLFD